MPPRITSTLLLLHSPLQLRLRVLPSIRCYANIDKSSPTRKQIVHKLDDDLKALHYWIKDLKKNSIPKDMCKVSFARSSGPGGQNVNKYAYII
jgi:protein subunit release factor A